MHSSSIQPNSWIHRDTSTQRDTETQRHRDTHRHTQTLTHTNTDTDTGPYTAGSQQNICLSPNRSILAQKQKSFSMASRRFDVVFGVRELNYLCAGVNPFQPLSVVWIVVVGPGPIPDSEVDFYLGEADTISEDLVLQQLRGRYWSGLPCISEAHK